MISSLRSFYRTGPNKSVQLGDERTISRIYERMRLEVFLSTTIGYGFFYICRLSLSVAKKPMLEEGILDPEQMGIIGSAMFFTYAFGKFFNGLLADRSNIKRFMTTGLVVSAIFNLIFGGSSSFLLFVLLWGINGWFQSMGSAPSAVALSHWFSNRERGTRYGFWSMCNNIGEGLTYNGTAYLVGMYGWRSGFIGPGLSCLLIAAIMYRYLADRPQTYGLPHIADYRNDHSESTKSKESVGRLQLEVLKNPAVLVLGLSSALMYVARYAINNWSMLYLQETKNYTLIEAGSIVGTNAIVGIAGVVFAGYLSDRFFNARRNLPCLFYAALEIGAIVLLYLVPPGHPILDTVALGVFGFAIGGLMVYLGGLMAIDISSKKATGAAMGVIGIFSYLGAAIQDYLSGYLIETNKFVDLGGNTRYDFDQAFLFWIGASILSMILPLFLWKVKHRD